MVELKEGLSLSRYAVWERRELTGQEKKYGAYCKS